MRATEDEAWLNTIGTTTPPPEAGSSRKASRQKKVAASFSTSAVRSAGLATEPKSGTTVFSFAAVSGAMAGSVTPCASVLSAQMTAAPPEVESTPPPPR